jgi:hypothetical protein
MTSHSLKILHSTRDQDCKIDVVRKGGVKLEMFLLAELVAVAIIRVCRI